MFTGHTEKIYLIKWHTVASGILASASYDMKVKIWNVDKQEDVITLCGHTEQVLPSVLHITELFAIIYAFCTNNKGGQKHQYVFMGCKHNKTSTTALPDYIASFK